MIFIPVVPSQPKYSLGSHNTNTALLRQIMTPQARFLRHSKTAPSQRSTLWSS